MSSWYLFSPCFCGFFPWTSSFFYRVSINISHRAGLVVTYSFSSCLSWNFLFLCPFQHPLEPQLNIDFSFWGCHLFPLPFLMVFSLFFSFFLSFLPCHQLVFYVTRSSTSLTLVVRTSSLDCISFNWFLISAWLDLNSAVMKSLESFMLFSRAMSSFINCASELAFWHQIVIQIL